MGPGGFPAGTRAPSPTAPPCATSWARSTAPSTRRGRPRLRRARVGSVRGDRGRHLHGRAPDPRPDGGMGQGRPVGREAAVGRRLDNGAPLPVVASTTSLTSRPRTGSGFPVIDPASHVARARSDGPRQRFLRRAYNYTVPDPHAGHRRGLGTGLHRLRRRPRAPVRPCPAPPGRARTGSTNGSRPSASAVYAVPPGCRRGRVRRRG